MCLMCELIRRLVPRCLVPSSPGPARDAPRRTRPAAGRGELIEAKQPGLAPQTVDELGQPAVAELRDQLDMEAPVGIEVVDQVPSGRRVDDLVGDVADGRALVAR